MLKIFILIGSLFSGSAFAQQSPELSKAMVAFNRQDYAQARTQFESLARDGNVEAQFYLGMIYWGGLGVARDNQKAAFWYRKAADQGNAGAQNTLGVITSSGEGVQSDDHEAAA